MRHQKKARVNGHKKIWIDLDNSPHVPFFAPIIQELQRLDYSVTISARDAYQVYELADLFRLTFKRIGRHYGKSKSLKVLGTCVRALQLLPTAVSEKPDLALSHGSRAQIAVCALLGIPSICILDYEFAHFGLAKPTWLMVPEVIPTSSLPMEERAVLRYPGIKEDVYAQGLTPDLLIRQQLRLNEQDLVVTLRPPATEAHYHCLQSDKLFAAAIEFLSHAPDVKVILLPRNATQAASVRERWPDLFANGKAIIPERAINGLSLIWHSDLVISGGGTMNREAAALGVPVYSIFRGKIGAVDQYLASQGRLVLVETVEDVRTKIALNRRCRDVVVQSSNCLALTTIIEEIVGVVGSQSGQGATRYSRASA